MTGTMTTLMIIAYGAEAEIAMQSCVNNKLSWTPLKKYGISMSKVDTESVSHIIPEVAEVQGWLNESFKSGRERIVQSAIKELTNKAVFKIASGANNGKRSTEIDWQELLADFPIVFKRKAAKVLHSALIEKGYLVYAEGQKGIDWQPKPNKIVNKMMIIVPGQVEIDDENI